MSLIFIPVDRSFSLLSTQLDLAKEGLKALISDGIQSAIAESTLIEIKKFDLISEGIKKIISENDKSED